MNHRTRTYTAAPLIQELESCKPGKAFSAIYEDICCRILRYLFPAEFCVFRPQCRTHNGRHRMDLQVSLNGMSPFFSLVKDHFHSRYAVFEFKNYTGTVHSEKIDLTKKYYCPAAMRNIIFIISRRGLDAHARSAAAETIRNAQLMMDLTDSDLIEMLRMKDRGEDPSLYMMRKYDLLMMGASA